MFSNLGHTITNVNITNRFANRLREVSNEWNQEGNYCLTHLNNSERADVWFTVSQYLNDLADDIEQEGYMED